MLIYISFKPLSWLFLFDNPWPILIRT